MPPFTKQVPVDFSDGSRDIYTLHAPMDLTKEQIIEEFIGYFQGSPSPRGAFIQPPSYILMIKDQEKTLRKALTQAITQISKSLRVPKLESALTLVLRNLEEYYISPKPSLSSLSKSLTSTRDIALGIGTTGVPIDSQDSTPTLYALAQDSLFQERMLRSGKLKKEDIEKVSKGDLTPLKGIWKDIASFTSIDSIRDSGIHVQALGSWFASMQKFLEQASQLGLLILLVQNKGDMQKAKSEYSARTRPLQDLLNQIYTSSERNIDNLTRKTPEQVRKSGFREDSPDYPKLGRPISKEALRELKGMR